MASSVAKVTNLTHYDTKPEKQGNGYPKPLFAMQKQSVMGLTAHFSSNNPPFLDVPVHRKKVVEVVLGASQTDPA